MYDFNDIMEQLRAGRSIEDIGNEFATALNKAKAAHEAEEETKRKKEMAARQAKVDKASDIIYDAIEFLGDFYPKVVTALFPHDEYNTGEMAEHLVQAMDEAYAEVFEGKKSLFTKELEKLAGLVNELPNDLEKIFNSDEKLTNSIEKMNLDKKYSENKQVNKNVNQYKTPKGSGAGSDDDEFTSLLRQFLCE